MSLMESLFSDSAIWRSPIARELAVVMTRPIGRTRAGYPFLEEIFASYCRAGIVLLFTEATGLAVEDLLATAWNTYHAGFKYVHERSGQGLRPALPRPPSGLGGKMPASWTECAERAGYVRVASQVGKSRTVYPYPPPVDITLPSAFSISLSPRVLCDTLEPRRRAVRAAQDVIRSR